MERHLNRLWTLFYNFNGTISEFVSLYLERDDTSNLFIDTTAAKLIIVIIFIINHLAIITLQRIKLVYCLLIVMIIAE